MSGKSMWDEQAGDLRDLTGNAYDEEDEGAIRLHGVDGLDEMSQDELYALYVDVSSRLPKHDLRDVSLEEELVRQLRAVQALQNATLTLRDVPANQKAQVANSVASVLTSLSKLQTDVYTTERSKKLEALMVKAVRLMPQEAQKVFFDEYEKMLGAFGNG